MKYISYTKIRDVKSPSRGTSASAGIDFYVPNKFDDDFINTLWDNFWVNDMKVKDTMSMTSFDLIQRNLDDVFICIPPFHRIAIPMGVRTTMAKGTALVGFNKSGVAMKKGLILGPCLVDSDYTGELMCGLINTNNAQVIVHAGEKILQMVHIEYNTLGIGELTNENYADMTKDSERGEGRFGSTNKQ